jgi:periplasmic divalent cation tolerance protein
MSQPQERFVVLSTAPDESTGAALAAALVKARIAACVSILPGMRSFYRWEGEVRDDAEVLLVAKTTASRLDALIETLEGAHPYECPEIVALPVAAGLPAYLEWIETATTEIGGGPERSG